MPLIGHFAALSLTGGFLTTAAVMLLFTTLATLTVTRPPTPGTPPPAEPRAGLLARPK
ncbi:hypothetical protein [Streptomyces sp. NPDC048340]